MARIDDGIHAEPHGFRESFQKRGIVINEQDVGGHDHRWKGSTSVFAEWP